MADFIQMFNNLKTVNFQSRGEMTSRQVDLMIIVYTQIHVFCEDNFCYVIQI